MIVAGSNGGIRIVNSRTEEVFGYPRNELVGKKVEILMPARFRSRHRQFRNSYFAHPTVRPMDQGRDLRGRHRDGAEFPVDISLSPVSVNGKTMAILTIRDVTERRKMESALRESEEHFRMALMHTPVVVFNQDRKLRYTWIYSSIPAWLGQEFVGHTDAEIFERKEAAHLSSVKRTVLRSGVGARDEAEVTFLGKKHYFDLTVEPLYGRRQSISGLTGAYFDVTAMRSYALERERLIAQLQAALEEVKLLSGFLSICASCKRIFNEEGAWQQMERYIESHSGVKFSHGLCPDCLRNLYPEYRPG
jgi:PAS domain S-box-containing protein